MEIILIVLMIAVGIIFLKILFWAVKVGLFIVILPLKILIAVIGAVIGAVLLPAILFPVAITGVLILPLLLLGLGIFLILKFAV
jgi:hypothetical protein